MKLHEINTATEAALRARLGKIAGELAELEDDDSEEADVKIERLADERRAIMFKLGMK